MGWSRTTLSGPARYSALILLFNRSCGILILGFQSDQAEITRLWLSSQRRRCWETIPCRATAQFVIGSAIALTGKYAREGTFVKKGYDFWSDKVNAQGGIEVGGKRYPVEIIYYDDRSDPQTSTKLVEKLITEDKVDLVFGPYSSDCVGPSSTITEKYKVPMMESGGGATPLFRRGFKFLFCTLMLGEDQAEAPMKLLARQIPRPKTIAIIAPKTPFTLSSAEGYRKYAAKYGFEVVHYETYPARHGGHHADPAQSEGEES